MGLGRQREQDNQGHSESGPRFLTGRLPSWCDEQSYHRSATRDM
jgi:hypothetical protein